MKQALQKGFTLIELVVVIVILGILAAVAIPQFTSVENSARNAVGQAACGALSSAAVMLYASNKLSSGYAAIHGTVTVTDGGSFGGSCSAPTYTPLNGTAVSCNASALPSTFCSGA